MADNGDMLIWWLDQSACKAINDACGTDRPAGMPEYIWDQYRSRYGRPGRGRLWVADFLGEVKIDPWPDTLLAIWLGRDFGGIVIHARHHDRIDYFPGVVTDLKLNRMELSDGGRA